MSSSGSVKNDTSTPSKKPGEPMTTASVLQDVFKKFRELKKDSIRAKLISDDEKFGPDEI
jgi:hypothetical protein